MYSKVFQRHSLKTRVTLSTLAIFLVGIWSLAFYASQVLREDIRLLLGEQQLSTTTAVATDINNELDLRFRALGSLAELMAPGVVAQQASLQTWIQQRPITTSLFNSGFLVYRRDGTVVDADVRLLQRLGSNGNSNDAVAAALHQGVAAVGPPMLDPERNAALLLLVAPVRDAQGTVVGAVAGLTNLGEPNFLDRVTGKHSVRTGSYLLVAPRYRRVVMASDKGRILEALPAPGVDPSVDRFTEGGEGFGLSRSRSGEEVLSSTVKVPLSGWTLSSVLPTSVAFAPIRAMQQRMLLAALLLTLLMGGLTWWMLRRQFAPMLDAVRALATASDQGQVVQPLVAPQQDEVGALIAGFNRLLQTLGERERAQQQAEARYRTLVDWSPDAVVVYVQGRIVYLNPAAVKLLGASSESELLGTPIIDRLHPDSAALANQRMRQVAELGRSVGNAELKTLRLDGTVVHVEAQGTAIMFDGIPAVHSVLRDITQRKQADEELRIAATAFETQQGMLVANGDWTILRVNQAFCDMTGYTVEECVGQTPQSLLRSERHDGAFFDTMVETLARTGTWQGEVWDKRKNGETFPVWLTITSVKDAAGTVTHYVDTLTDITARKATEQQIQSLAFYDPLTELPNRRLLMDRLTHAMDGWSRHQRRGALLFVDLDNFKILNDTYGHHKGDLLLQAVATRLSTCIRKGDTVARLGGDEFVVMLEGLSQDALEAATQAEAVGDKVLALLNESYQLGDNEHHSTPSIGITLFGAPDEGIEEPLKRADMAMYQAKAAGRNTLRFFDPHMQSVVTARAALEAGMREALVRHEFLLYYQAQVVGEGQLTGVEVLVRWKHPQRGMVSPAEFIPLAEDTGLILPLGHWVLHTACTQLARWAHQPQMAHLAVAVNVSPRQFNQSDFVEQVLDVLERTGANPQRLKLELTESMLVSNVEDVIAKMAALKTVGVGFSLDDFGTGYSSLSHLKLLPLDQLKIDQSFVRDILTDPNDAAIANMVVVLARSLGLAVIAEGVETEAQRQFLATQGCHAYQGYLFSRPLPLEEFEALALRD